MGIEEDDVRVGVDLVRISDIENSIERFGEPYLRHVFSDAERQACAGPPRRFAEGLAARFAAKEAVIKVLRPNDVGGLWSSIEVCSHASGAPDLLLHGPASVLAAQAGIDRFALSMTHEGDVAVAVVVATHPRQSAIISAEISSATEQPG